MVRQLPAPPVKPREDQGSADLPTLALALDARQEQFAALLGSPQAVARFRTVALHAVSSRPDLLECTPLSLIESIREAATLDLEPTGVLGEAWLVPYKRHAKLRIGWQGHLKLIRRSGLVGGVDCQVVYENDDFGVAYEQTPPFWHRPILSGDRGSFRGAYAWAKLLTGEYIFEWLPMADVAPIRKIAAADSLMWNEFPGEGMRKSAVRRLAKRLPKSAHLAHALEIEEETENETRPTVTVSSPARDAARAALAARFDQSEVRELQEPQVLDQGPAEEEGRVGPAGTASHALGPVPPAVEEIADDEMEHLLGLEEQS